ncbi:MAG: SIS domain-containing protein [Erysipelotrichales bacterium]|nr:SIS domain-containing protein [Erysipelotrichales bacterium]
MLTFHKEEIKASINGALALRAKINEIVDPIYDQGITNICFMGIGGTLASSMQVFTHMQEKSSLEVICQSAAEYTTTGNRRIGSGTLLVLSSVSGTTKEIVSAVTKAKVYGATVLGFIDNKDAVLARMVDHVVTYPANEQLKFFMVADRLMFHEGVFSDYEEYYTELEEHLADALVDVGEKSEEFAREFVAAHHEDMIHYFVGAGNQWGATYSYAMCYWEEQHWLRTKSIHAAEFFHGMFEIVDKNMNVTVFVGEDSQRELAVRVANFLPQICHRYTIIDTKNYALEGISEKYRGSISHLVMRQVCHRIDMEMERVNAHPTVIRRYYRQLEY